MVGVQQLSKKPTVRLVTAAGTPIQITNYVQAAVKVGNAEVTQQFLVVDSLIAPVILGIDFMKRHKVTLDFTTTPVGIHLNGVKLAQQELPQELQEMWKARCNEKSKVCAAAILDDGTVDPVDECSIPLFNAETSYDFPNCENESLASVITEYKDIFRTTPGMSNETQHYIHTTGSPARVPPRRVPVHYREEVEAQIQQMLEQGIIEESSSPWMAPAVFVKKKTGELRICVDYRELNKKTTKDAYPLPLPDEVQNRLAGATIFTTLDLQCGYWQVPISSEDRAKTAFCPGPDMGLFQFCRMPFGLTGAPSTFQRMMNKIFRGLPFVTVYVDDVLVHSATAEQHRAHLQQVFQRVREAGLTLKGKKCQVAMSAVHYLGHIFSGAGMSPDVQKIKAVQEWPIPTTVKEVRRFLGLASYYRRYILHFADISKPLNSLTQKDVPFKWSNECAHAFNELKSKLITAPILSYPQFHQNASQFVLQTDASAAGLGAVLEQDGHVIAYASRTLNKAEQQYSVIQKECLAAVYAMKQFRHYLLGRPFTLVTDHAPLQWLSAQKMEGLLCRWALSMQEYTFTIQYRSGSQNVNADALSRRDSPPKIFPSALTQISNSAARQQLLNQQKSDPVVKEILQALSQSSKKPSGQTWKCSPLNRYRQLWSHLKVVDGIVYRIYTPDPTGGTVTVPVLPQPLHQQALQSSHDIPSAGHQGVDKTLHRLRREAYWVNMAGDVETYCRQCTRCQQCKAPAPIRAPLTSVPIGKPWQMIAVDILEVPVSRHNNRYLLVIQDYFTKWAEAIPLRDQTALSITTALVNLFSRFGIPDIVHSDQGRNFESTLLKQTLEAFGTTKTRTTAYHPQGDGMVERFNRSLLQLLRTYVEEESDWERFLPLVLHAYRTSVHSSTGVSPFMLMLGRQPKRPDLGAPDTAAYDPTSYQAQITCKMAKLQDFVETHLVHSATKQQTFYNKHSEQRQFKVGDPVWLSIPTAGKLDPKWEGGWKIVKVVSPINMQIQDGKRTRVVHVNRLRHRFQPALEEEGVQNGNYPPWTPPQIEHSIVPGDDVPPPPSTRRYPSRIRRPPDYFQ